MPDFSVISTWRLVFNKVLAEDGRFSWPDFCSNFKRSSSALCLMLYFKLQSANSSANKKFSLAHKFQTQSLIKQYVHFGHPA